MRGFGKGVQLIENPGGGVQMTFVEHSQMVFSGPVVVEKRIFRTWTEAINFLKLWDTLSHVQWWESQIETAILGIN